jgi:hypothetical protein
MAKLALADAADRLRDVPGFPRRPGRPRRVVTLPGPSVPAPVVIAKDDRKKRRPPPSAKIPPRLMSVDAIATYLGGIDTDYIYELVASGALPRVRLPRSPGSSGSDMRKILVEKSAVDAWLDAQPGAVRA